MNNYQKAQDPNTSPEELAILVTDEDCDVRYGVAQNPNTPPKALEQLSTDGYWHVRYLAAHHPNATEIVRRLYLMTEAQTNSKTGT